MSYYEELKIEREATKADIKKAFRNLSLQNHPDKGGDEEKFKKISEAYNTLIDDDKRRQYDLSLNRPNMSGFRTGFQRGNPFGAFETMFHFTSGMRSGVKLPDTVHEVELNLDEVYYGIEKKIKVTTECKCDCIQQCRMCNGTGQVQEIMGGRGIIKLVTNGCGSCLGRGFVSMKGVSCECCKGNGMYQKEELYTLTIDAGITDGSILKFDDKGQQAVKQNQISGDLIFKFKIKESNELGPGPEGNPKIKTDGYNIVLTFEIDIIDVMFGSEIEIKYFDKTFKLNTNNELILENKDYVNKNEGIKNKGDLIIRYKYSFDKLSTLTPQQKSEMRNMFNNLVAGYGVPVSQTPEC
jgi:DnaJ family protein A protein 2